MVVFSVYLVSDSLIIQTNFDKANEKSVKTPNSVFTISIPFIKIRT